MTFLPQFNYYSSFIFGSELKAIKIHPSFENEINKKALSLQLSYHFIPSTYSIYKNIQKLLPGHFILLNDNHFKKKKIIPSLRQYWSLLDNYKSEAKNLFEMNYEQTTNKLDKLLTTTVKNQMISDVPYGAFLSGGVDSSTFVALMQKQSSKKIKTFSIGFDQDGYDETKYSKKIAKHLGTDHDELYIDEKKIISIVQKLPSIYCEPFSDTSQIPTILVSEIAKQKITVALSGDGADELFNGYKYHYLFNKIWNILRFIPSPVKKIIEKLIFSLNPQTWNKLINLILNKNEKFSNIGDKLYKGANLLKDKNFEYLYLTFLLSYSDKSVNFKDPIENLQNLLPELSELDNYKKMTIIDGLINLAEGILTKVDRAAMSYSLETRMPFLDHRIIEFTARLPKSFIIDKKKNKKILRDVLSRYVPRELTDRPKKGFSLPINTLLRGPLRDWAESLLVKIKYDQGVFLNHKFIIEKWNEHLSGKRKWESFLWNILMFQAWREENRKNF